MYKWRFCYYSFVTARSCFLGRMQENQGLREFEEGFLYQIYTREIRIWGCDMAEKKGICFRANSFFE